MKAESQFLKKWVMLPKNNNSLMEYVSKSLVYIHDWGGESLLAMLSRLLGTSLA